MQTINAIETAYKGYRFRSRLEARWAVFFDALDMRWEYEKEGFDINGTWYLPDFYLQDISCYAEVKPEVFTYEEFSKAAALECIFLDGIPEERFYDCATPSTLPNIGEYGDYTAGRLRWGCAAHWGWIELHGGMSGAG